MCVNPVTIFQTKSTNDKMLPYFLPAQKYLSKINVISAYNYKLILVFDSLRQDETKRVGALMGKSLVLVAGSLITSTSPDVSSANQV